MSEYDGHENYRAESVRRASSMRGSFDTLLGLGAMAGAMPLTYQLLDPASRGEKLIFGFIAAVAGLIVGAALGGLMSCLRFKHSPHLFKTEMLAILIAAVGLGTVFVSASRERAERREQVVERYPVNQIQPHSPGR